MIDAVIVDAVRSPMAKGKAGGALSSLHPVELLAQTVKGLLDRVGIDPGQVDDVLTGCVSQVGEQAGNVGRMAWLAAGLPIHVPSTTVERKCGSSQQAAHFAAQGVMAGAYDIAVVAGVESMSRIPMGASAIGMDPYGPSVAQRFAPGLIPQGISAELIAAKWKLSREQQDAYASNSHARAAARQADGGFQREIVPIVVTDEAGNEVVVDRDETIRPSTTPAKLAELKPAFENPAHLERFPEIDWSVTAGNSSQITDGASAMLVMSATRAEQLGLTPRARFHSFAVAADDPILMLTGPIPATHKLLAKAGIGIDDIDHYEINEAFAPVPLAWQSEFDADPARLNPAGGAIALGHPLGGSGARLMTTMLHALEDTNGRFGLQSMCEAGGMANATLIERL
ncbi:MULTISPECIES: thiolase family protein [unclassified Nocardioides]|uniref:thiolase family protein n=1 Tax=unclassified Nocardioides TaxID=2615069 RepID=UPI00070263D9|nr:MULTISPECIES: thiolase family protein [unclassified Nocardioides]KRC53803.1 acetyl-CoA acetyltransferase [Nocardioides sp. Root79]KRC71138.1 acetyl-CoA acetyltransferase [Nocardioides sp. Root240]